LRGATSICAGSGAWTAGEGADLRREGRAEQQVLALLRQQREHALDVVDEAHVEHAVGLVEHEDLDAGEIDGLLTGEIEESAGRRDDDVGAALQRLDLRVHADAAEDRDRTQRKVRAVGAHALGDLGAELARRHHDEGTDVTPALRARLHQPLEHGQGEAGGLAGTRLGRGHQVAALEDRGDGARLHGRGGRIAFVGHGTNELGHQAEILESGHDVS
jgi:hypothetical protein